MHGVFFASCVLWSDWNKAFLDHALMAGIIYRGYSEYSFLTVFTVFLPALSVAFTVKDFSSTVNQGSGTNGIKC